MRSLNEPPLGCSLNRRCGRREDRHTTDGGLVGRPGNSYGGPTAQALRRGFQSLQRQLYRAISARQAPTFLQSAIRRTCLQIRCLRHSGPPLLATVGQPPASGRSGGAEPPRPQGRRKTGHRRRVGLSLRALAVEWAARDPQPVTVRIATTSEPSESRSACIPAPCGLWVTDCGWNARRPSATRSSERLAGLAGRRP
jgi:hypothetical protein